MTKKSVVITTSVLLGLILVFTILFGVVFRVRNINVVYADDFCYKTQIDGILDVSNLSKNDSLFTINRNKVVRNIERAYPYTRVEGVNISSFTSIKIKLSNRQPLYYIVENAIYYILDEDCKVLEITNNKELATKYILLTDVFSVSENTKAGEFLDSKYAKICSNLYKALYTNAMLNIGDDIDQDGEPDKKYLERQDMYNLVKNIKFSVIDELDGKMDKLVMTSSYGVNIEIVEPQQNLDRKINMAFSALREIIARDKQYSTNLSSSGSIIVRYSYDENNNTILKCEYHA